MIILVQSNARRSDREDAAPKGLDSPTLYRKEKERVIKRIGWSLRCQ